MCGILYVNEYVCVYVRIIPYDKRTNYANTKIDDTHNIRKWQLLERN